MYKGKANWTEDRMVYAGMLTAADEGIGQIVDELQAAGMWGNTLVVVTTDNGGPLNGLEYDDWSPPDGSARGVSNFPLRGGKGSVFEGGISGDALLAGGVLETLGIERGKSNNAMFHGLDWLPTLAEMVSIEPEGVFTKLDGVSQLNALRTSEPARSEFHGGYTRNRIWGDPYRESAYRTEEMKLIWNRVQNSALLFNMTSDIREEFDLSGQLPLVWEQIKGKMDQVQQNFIEQVPVNEEGCTYSEGLTWWGEPALHLFCNESTPLVPPPAPVASANPAPTPVAAQTSAPVFDPAPPTPLPFADSTSAPDDPASSPEPHSAPPTAPPPSCVADSVAAIVSACLASSGETNAATECGRCYEGVTSSNIDVDDCMQLQDNICGVINGCDATCTPGNKCRSQFGALQQCVGDVIASFSGCPINCSDYTPSPGSLSPPTAAPGRPTGTPVQTPGPFSTAAPSSPPPSTSVDPASGGTVSSCDVYDSFVFMALTSLILLLK